MIEIRHIGVVTLCGLDGINFKIGNATHRTDLTYKHYRSLETHRFRGEPPFKYCKRCLAVIKALERRFA